MSKLIIENRTDMTMMEVFPYVQSVMTLGKISETGKGKQYCFHTTFKDGTLVSAFKNAKSDRLVISKISTEMI